MQDIPSRFDSMLRKLREKGYRITPQRQVPSRSEGRKPINKKLWYFGIFLLLVVVVWVVPGDGLAAPKAVETKHEPAANSILIEKLGKSIFFDKNLSVNNNQSCAACHAPSVGFTGPDPSINALGGIYMGSVDGLFANRKPPSAAYGGSSPVLHKQGDGTWCGGMFWDGRATGEKLADPLAEQAQAHHHELDVQHGPQHQERQLPAEAHHAAQRGGHERVGSVLVPDTLDARTTLHKIVEQIRCEDVAPQLEESRA